MIETPSIAGGCHSKSLKKLFPTTFSQPLRNQTEGLEIIPPSPYNRV